MADRIVTPAYIESSLNKFNEWAGLKLSAGKVEGNKKPVLKDGDQVISRPMPIWLLVPSAEAYATGKMVAKGKKLDDKPSVIWPWDKAAEIKLQAKEAAEGKKAAKKAAKAEKKAAKAAKKV